MKKIMLLTLLIGSVSFAKNKTVGSTPTKTVQADASQTKEIKVGVKGMVCAFCAQGIEKNFLKQPEVSKVEVSLENKYVKLQFKDGMSLAKEKIATILKEAGYESVFEE